MEVGAVLTGTFGDRPGIVPYYNIALPTTLVHTHIRDSQMSRCKGIQTFGITCLLSAFSPNPLFTRFSLNSGMGRMYQQYEMRRYQ